MKIAAAIAQYLMGLAFVGVRTEHVPGLHSLGATADGASRGVLRGDVFHALYARRRGGDAGFGILFLLNRFVALGLTLLGPVLVNILLFHLFMQPRGIWMGVLVSLLWVLMAWRHRAAFAGTFQASSRSESSQRPQGCSLVPIPCSLSFSLPYIRARLRQPDVGQHPADELARHLGRIDGVAIER